MKCILLGFTLDDQTMGRLIDEDPGMPAQTHNFAWAVTDAMNEAGIELTLASAEPRTNFPAGRGILIRRKRFRERGVDGATLPYVNLLVAKHVSRFISCLIFVLPHLWNDRDSALIIHGVHSPFLWFGRLAKALRGIPVVTILTDPPGVAQHTDGRIVTTLRQLDVALVRGALNGMSGVVCLTNDLGESFAPRVPRLVMEGIVRPLPGDSFRDGPRRRFMSNIEVVYAGGLKADYGVRNLVLAVEKLGASGPRLTIYGKGELAGWVEQKAQECPRIQGPRFATREELSAIYEDADLLAQPRPSTMSESSLSFPSKLLEYMSTGTLVLSTRLSGIPEEYFEYVLDGGDGTVEALMDALNLHQRMTAEERRALASKAQQFVLTAKSTHAQGRRIADFLSRVAAKGGRRGPGGPAESKH